MDEIRKITSPSVVREIYPILNEIEPEAKRQSAIISKEWLICVFVISTREVLFLGVSLSIIFRIRFLSSVMKLT